MVALRAILHKVWEARLFIFKHMEEHNKKMLQENQQKCNRLTVIWMELRAKKNMGSLIISYTL